MYNEFKKFFSQIKFPIKKAYLNNHLPHSPWTLMSIKLSGHLMWHTICGHNKLIKLAHSFIVSQHFSALPFTFTFQMITKFWMIKSFCVERLFVVIANKKWLTHLNQPKWFSIRRNAHTTYCYILNVEYSNVTIIVGTKCAFTIYANWIVFKLQIITVTPICCRCYCCRLSNAFLSSITINMCAGGIH